MTHTRDGLHHRLSVFARGRNLTLEELAVSKRADLVRPGVEFPEGFSEWHSHFICPGELEWAPSSDVEDQRLRMTAGLQNAYLKVSPGLDELPRWLQNKSGQYGVKACAALLRAIRVKRCSPIPGKTQSDARVFLLVKSAKVALSFPLILHGFDFEKAELIAGKETKVTSDWLGRGLCIVLVVDGVTEKDPLLCTLKQEGNRIFCTSPRPFVVQGSLAVFPRPLLNKDHVRLYNGTEFKVRSSRAQDQTRGPTEQTFNPSFLHILVSLGDPKRAKTLEQMGGLLGRGPPLRCQSQVALLDLVFACLHGGLAQLEQQGLTIPARTEDWVGDLLRCLFVLSRYNPSNGSSNSMSQSIWLSALQSSLSLWVMDLLEAPGHGSGGLEFCKKDQIMTRCRDMLQCPPIIDQKNFRSGAFVRIDDSLVLYLEKPEEAFRRERIQSQSVDVSNNSPFLLRRCQDGLWWLLTGPATVFEHFGHNAEVPLYSGCRFQVGAHSLQFFDPAQPQLVGQADRVFLDGLTDLGQECYEIITKNKVQRLQSLKGLIWPEDVNTVVERRCVWSLVRLVGSTPTCSFLWHSKIVGLDGQFTTRNVPCRSVAFSEWSAAETAARGLPFDQCGKPSYDEPLKGEPYPARSGRSICITGSISCLINDEDFRFFGSTGWERVADVTVRVPEPDLGNAWDRHQWNRDWLALLLAMNRHNEAHKVDYAIDMAVRTLLRGRRQFLAALLSSKSLLHGLLQEKCLE